MLTLWLHCTQGRDGVLVLCLLPRVAATLPGTVLVRLVHETAASSVHLSVAHDPETKALMFQSIVLEVRWPCA